MGCSIYFSSYYGSTQEYADELARRLGTQARPIPRVADQVADPDADPSTDPTATQERGPLIVLAPAHGPLHDGVKFLKALGTVDRPTAIITVGMTLEEELQVTDPTAALLGPLAPSVTRFYLPGRLNYSELTATHRNVMRGLVAALKLKPGKSDNERNIIDSYGQDVDRVDLTRLDQVVAWVESNQR